MISTDDVLERFPSDPRPGDRVEARCILCGTWLSAQEPGRGGVRGHRACGTLYGRLRSDILEHLKRVHGGDFGDRGRSVLADALVRERRRVGT